jgi:uncharacterized protein YciW
MDLLTIAKKIADRVEAESLKQTYRMRLGGTAPSRREPTISDPGPTPRAAARIYAGWASLRRGLTGR